MIQRHEIVERLDEMVWFCRCGQTFNSRADAIFHLRRAGAAILVGNDDAPANLASLNERGKV